ncbi:hypothetical protein BY996DRAFT_6481846 [Phakopsora pachyrhizi]|uniref:Uncharacterized protein n=1 Tax=Phakopsora pachyrhizi TaxID=170000 RepID=A0AAV0AU00_PHAPC|nr:hypothetical protein BY996DRAFT_6481846 [Phakopsora pachyrhizi]CAH7672903.1 hypothetical protein PPACK8108_LOCUS7739 [Phakopsora pachyrhizi]
MLGNKKRGLVEVTESIYQWFWKLEIRATTWAHNLLVNKSREESELQMKQEEVKKELEYKRLEYAKEEKDKDMVYAREEKEKDCELKLLLVEKEREELKRKEDREMLLAVVGSSRSLAEISEIAKILNID